MTKHRIALLIDLDNAMLAAENLGLQHCRESGLWVGPLVEEVERVVGGRVEQRLAYGNVSLHCGSAFQDRVYDPRQLRSRHAFDSAVQAQLAEHGFRVVHTPTRGGAGKNAADILLCLEAVEIAARCPHVDVFAVMSHDSDFSPLVHRLRALGREVALVTVGEPRHAGMAGLRAMTQWQVIFDQRLVDQAGYQPLQAVLEQLRSDDASPLRAGVNLSVVLARLVEAAPRFTPEMLGFDKFRTFVEACLEPPYALKEGRLCLVADATRQDQRGGDDRPRNAEARRPSGPSGHEPLDLPRTADGGNFLLTPPTTETRSGCRAPDRAAILGAALRRCGLHPRVEYRSEVGRALRGLLDQHGGAAITMRELTGRLIGDLADQGISATAVRDCLNLFRRSGSLRVSAGNESLNDAVIESFAASDEVRRRVAYEACRALSQAGEALLTDDIPVLAVVLFGSAEEGVGDLVSDAMSADLGAAK